jgi:hypothetical protein
MASMRNLLLPGALVLALCGCGNPDKARLERGVEYAQSRLEEVNHSAVAAMSFGSIEEQGGTVVAYLTAGMPSSAELPRFEMNKASQAWTVVIKNGPGPHDFTIEGYGTDLAQPLKTATVTFHPGSGKSTP